MIYTNPYGRLTVDVNTDDFTVAPDGGLIVHRMCSAFPVCKGIAGSNEADLEFQATDLPAGVGAVAMRTITAGDAQERMKLFGSPGRSHFAEALPVVTVPWGRQDYSVFRPPVLGTSTNPIVKWFRDNPIQIASLRLERLRDVLVMPDDFDVAALTRRFSAFSGDCWSGWATDTRTPDLQHHGYGSAYAADISVAFCALNAKNVAYEQKKELAIALVQRGIDMIGAFSDGRQNWMVDGGHMWGRWPLMMLAGILLNIPQVIYPDPRVASRFVERRAFYHGQPAWWCGMEWGWRRGWSDPDFLWRHPSEWTRDTRGNVWAISGYLPHVVGAHVGIILALKLMGYAGQFADAMRGMVEQWMSPPKDGVLQALRDNGCSSVSEAWGKSISFTGYGELCSSLWKQVYD